MTACIRTHRPTGYEGVPVIMPHWREPHPSDRRRRARIAGWLTLAALIVLVFCFVMVVTP